MDQRVLVTAAPSGIGRKIARAFAVAGGKVFVCDIAALAALPASDAAESISRQILPMDKEMQKAT